MGFEGPGFVLGKEQVEEDEEIDRLGSQAFPNEVVIKTWVLGTIDSKFNQVIQKANDVLSLPNLPMRFKLELVNTGAGRNKHKRVPSNCFRLRFESGL